MSWAELRSLRGPRLLLWAARAPEVQVAELGRLACSDWAGLGGGGRALAVAGEAVALLSVDIWI